MKRPLSFLIAPDSFKDSMSSTEVGSYIEKGIKSVFKDANIDRVPMADGGEGTVQAILNACDGKQLNTNTHDALGRPITGFFGMINHGQTAIIEMATASGIELLSKEERNPYLTSTYGTGELIKAALDYGCREIIVAIGGSATNDGGMGMAKALGIDFFDINNKELPEGGYHLGKLHKVNMTGLDKRIAKTRIIAATDVTSPLTGKSGASYVYSKQKGASDEMAEVLETNMKHWAGVIENSFNMAISDLKGGGAAGGLGAGLKVFLNAEIESGFQTIANLTGLEEKIKKADIVFTAEGKVDDQTESGKVPIGIANMARINKKPVFILTGNATIHTNKLYKAGVTGVFSIIRKPVDLSEAISKTGIWIEKCTEEICRTIKAVKNL